MIYLMYKSAKFGLVLTVTYLYMYIYSKGSNPLKVLMKENKVIYQKCKSAKFGLVSYCH